MPVGVLAGLPSELLERRPDVRETEANMMAANAQIGVAKAAFFPSIALTGTGGLESNALNRFISAPSETWYGAFSVAQPLFEDGALRSQPKLSRAQYQETVLAYQQTVQNALQQVSNGLIASQKNREFREQQELLAQAAERSDRPPLVSLVLYQGRSELSPGVDQRDELFFCGAKPCPGPA